MITWFIWFLVIFALFAGDYFRKTFLSSGYQQFFYHLLLLVAILFAGFRYKIGNDYDVYTLIYERVSSDPLSTYVEPGFAYCCYLLSLMGLNYQGMFMVFAAATILLIGYTLNKYSVHPSLSFMIFLLAPTLYFNALCIVRQFFVVAVLFAAVPFIIERKFWKFFVCLVISATFHRSAVLMLGFYFLAPLNINKYLFLAILAAVIIYPPARLVNGIFLFADYNGYLSAKAPEFGFGSTLLFRVAICIFVLFSRDRFEDSANKIITNLYLLGVIFYFSTLTTEALSRISLYLTIFEIIAVVNTIYLFARTDRIRMSFIYVAYCALAFFQNLHGYSKYYIRGSSEGNINYSANMKLWGKPAVERKYNK